MPYAIRVCSERSKTNRASYTEVRYLAFVAILCVAVFCLFSVLVVAQVNSAKTDQTTSDSSLISSYQMLPNSTNTLVDSSGNHENGTLTNFISSPYVPGPIANSTALTFGSNSSVSIPFSQTVDIPPTYGFVTFVTYFKSAVGLTPAPTTVATGVDSGRSSWVLMIDQNGLLSITLNQNSATTVTIPASNAPKINDGNWHSLAVAVSPNLVSLYVDGQETDSSAAWAGKPCTSLTLGVTSPNETNVPFTLGSTALYQRVLSSTEIAAIFGTPAPSQTSSAAQPSTSNYSNDSESVLYSFAGPSADGMMPQAGLFRDSLGNLLGTTSQGGTAGGGTVFELPYSNGTYGPEKVLYNFSSAPTNAAGNYPYSTLISDAAGNLYGTTFYGGANDSGTVFEIPYSNGTYGDLKTLYAFAGGADGNPGPRLAIDGSGNLFGTSFNGGSGELGAVFEIPYNFGTYGSDKILYSFTSASPSSGLVIDGSGNLFGTLGQSANSTYGSVFEIPLLGGNYGAAQTLYSFKGGTDGSSPAGVIVDSAGNLYGVTEAGGTQGYGTVYLLPYSGGSHGSDIILCSFTGQADAYSPNSDLVRDASGNLIGTSRAGGTNGTGAVYEIPFSGGSYGPEKVLYNFATAAQGLMPSGSLAINSSGDLFGLTGSGGANYGTVYELKAPAVLVTGNSPTPTPTPTPSPSPTGAQVSGKRFSQAASLNSGTANSASVSTTSATPLVLASPASTLKTQAALNITQWAGQDIGSVPVAGTDSYNSTTGVYTIAGSGPGVAGTADAFHFVSESISGDGELQARVASVQNVNAGASAGLMIRQSTATGSACALITVSSGNGINFVQRTTANGPIVSVQTGTSTAPYWVKIRKDGTLASVYESPDGTTWTYEGAVRLPLTSPVNIGFAVSSNTSTLCTATFDNINVTTQTTFGPALPWLDQDIGTPLQGQVHLEQNLWSVFGGGTGITGTADNFHYDYQPINGNGEIIAQVNGISGGSAGVLMRQNVSSGAAEVGVLFTQGSGISFVSRASSGATLTSTAGASVTTPYWVKLVRTGNSFSGYESPDGVAWTLISSQTITLTGAITSGLAVTSGNNTSLNLAILDKVAMTPWGGYLENGQISSGGDFSLYLRADGTVWSWGSNSSGQLGLPSASQPYTVPFQITPLSSMVQVSAGTIHSLALKSDGTVWAWGDNSFGELGDGTTTNQTVPEHITSLDSAGIVAVSAGNNFSLALSSDGTVWAWGNNASGEMGNGTVGQAGNNTLAQTSPVHLTLTGIVEISAGGSHALALTTGHAVYAWGGNGQGQLGDGTTQDHALPELLSGLSDIQQISAGAYHSLALDDLGTVWGWGDNSMGEIGDGTTSSHLTPFNLSLTNMSSVEAGSLSSFALGTDGSVWVWGDNSSSQLGDGTINQHLAPTQLTTISNVLDIGAGLLHGTAITSDSKVWAWGDNSFYQLGNGTTTGSSVPVQVKVGTYAPVISSSTTATGYVGVPFTGYTIAASNNPTSFSAIGLPSGLSVNTTTGAITGNPTTTGVSTVTLGATNAWGTGNATLTFTVSNRVIPVISSSLTATGQVGVAFAGYTITASNSPTSYSAVGLPPGLTINSATGVISGTPTLSGSYTVKIGATNSSGTGNASLAFTVNWPTPVITSASTATGAVGTASSYQITANNHPASYSASGLPAGLGVNSSSGAITGTPTTSGVYTVTLGAINPTGTGNATLTYTINPAKPAITSATTATGTQGTAIANYTIAGSNTPTSYSATGLPPGLSLSGAVISGTPTVAGSYPVVVGATNATGTGTATVTFTINNPAPVIVSPLTAIGVNGVSFSGYTIVANNSPTSFSATGLPSGLTVSTSSGAITGTPTKVGVSSVTIGATNAGGTTTATLSFTINPATPVISSATTATGTLGSTFSYQIAGSNSPTTFSATGLPAGLTLGSTGAITGTPTVSGTFSVIIGAANVTGTGKATLTLTVNNPKPAITSLTSAIGTTGSSFSYSITATNYPSGYTSTTLPGGLTLNGSTGVISGTPTTVGVTSVTLTATNASGSGTATLSITINAPKPAITSGTTATGTVSTAFAGYTIVASNTPTSYSAAGLPPGLSFSTSTGAITGTPTTAGVYPVTIGATNASGTGLATLTITVNAPVPAITSLLASQGTTGSAFTYAITATNSPTSYSATPLPTGLTLSTSNGKITGTPTVAGTTNVTISATNAAGTSPTATLVITLVSPIPSITSGTTASGTSGTAITNYTIVASNSPTSYSATGLPPGLTLNSSSGVISGTPSSTGVFAVTLGATNSGGTGTKTLTFTINPPIPVIESATTASGIVGTVFINYTIIASNSPTSYSQSGLPAGLTLDTGLGVISGTPTTAGTSTVTLHATNAGGTGNATLTITVVAAKPVITSPLTAGGTVNVAFSSYTVTGTNTPTSFSATGLPAGLSISATTGKITGTPTTAGTSTVTIGATNSGGTGSATVTFTIASAPVPVISSGATATGTVGVAFTGYTVAASNTPTSFSATGLPAGLAISGTSGAITGTPTNAGTYYVTLTATNAAGAGTALLTFTVNPPTPVITSAATFTATKGVAFNNYAVIATNSPTSYSASGLPSGLSINTTTGAITGTPTTAGTSTVTLGAKNVTGTGSLTLTATVNPAVPVISSAATATGTMGIAFSSYTIAASNTPTSFTASGLPPGLTVSSTTGAITGTPATVGTYAVTIGATNVSGTGTATLTFTVNPPKPVITSATSAVGITGSAFTYTTLANNSPTSYSSTALPDGLTLSSTSGVISGTPTTVGVTSVTLSAINNGGTGTATLSITINAPKPVISSATTASGTKGVAFSGYTIAATNAPTTFTASGLPPGLSVSSTTGAISGTPTTVGTYPVTIGAANASGRGTATLTISVYPPTPAITSSVTATGITGSSFSYSIQANNSPTSYNATGLPTGLTVNTSNGSISGTPTATGVSTVTLTATNGSGSGTATLTLTINAPKPVINSTLTATGTAGVAFSGYTITATNTPTSFSATGLPAGLALNSASGVISGTPTYNGSSSITIGATNASGTGTATLVLTVKNPTPVVTSLTTATAVTGSAFSYTITATNSPTGYSTSTLPAGLTLSGSKISGTPTATGVTPITLTATNANGSGTATLNLTVNAPAPSITSVLTETTVINTAFTYTITGSNTPTSFSAVGLPSGLSMAPTTGVISGTPTQLGTFSVTISATNVTGTGKATLSLTINPPAPVITSLTSATAVENSAFNYATTATNSPTSYSQSGLPTGLTMSSTTGAISGTPTVTGTFPVTLTATNATGSGTATLTITVNPPLPIVNSASTSTTLVGTVYGGYSITASNVTPTSYTATGLPPGLSINSSTGTITGTPTAIGTFTATVGASDASGTGSLNVTFTINPPAPVITASTASGTINQPFSYTISATNDPTSYTATNLPPGLNFNTNTGLISGTPSALGTTTVALSASNITGPGTANLVITINPPAPVVTAPSQLAALLNGAFTYQVPATNSPTSYSATGLPAGLTINTTTGVISGTPTVLGTTIASISATNGGGTTSSDVTIVVNQGPAVVSGLTAWYKADTGVVDDGSGNVVSWADQSPTQAQLVVNTSASPTIVPLSNGTRVLNFENQASMYNSTAQITNSDVTIIAVASKDVPANDGQLVLAGNNYVSGTCRGLAYSGGGLLTFVDGAGTNTGYFVQGGPAPTTTQLTINSISYAQSTGNTQFYSQGLPNPSQTIPPVLTGASATAPGISVGSAGGGFVSWSGNVSEILIYNRVLSASELQAAEGQLADKYGVYDINGTWFNAPQYAAILPTIRASGWTQTQANTYLQSLPTTLLVASGNNQNVASSAFAPLPLVVQASSSNGLLTNTPVTFTLTGASDGGLATTNFGTTATTQTVMTNSQGLATVYYQAGSDYINTNSVSATTTVAGTTGTASFNIYCGDQNGLSLWLRADRGVSQTGGTVSSWTDQTVNQTQLTVNTSAFPTVVALPNGTQELNFENQASMYNPTAQITNSDVTIIAVASKDVPTDDGQLLLAGNNYVSGTCRGLAYSGGGLLTFVDGAGTNTGYFVQGGPAPTTTQLTINSISYVQSTGNTQFYSQGLPNPTAPSVLTGASATAPGINVGSAAGGFVSWSGNVSEILVYNRVLTAAERQSIEGSLADKYGVYDVNGTWFNASQYAAILPTIRSSGWTQTQANAYLQALHTTLVASSGTSQSVTASAFATLPLVIQASGPSGFLTNTPVTFTLAAGSDGGLATTSGGTTASTQTVTTNSSGQATVYYQAGADFIATNTITASTTVNGSTGTASFTEYCGDQNQLAVWLRADRGVSQTSGIVSSWADQSASQAVLTPEGSTAPTVGTLPGGLSTLEFSNQAGLYCGNTVGGNDATIIAVSSASNPNNSGAVCEIGNGYNSQTSRQLQYSGGKLAFALNYGEPTLGGPVPATNQMAINAITYSNSGNTASFYSQGVANPSTPATVTMAGTSVDGGIGIGSAFCYGPWNTWNGNISEVVIYNRVLTSTEISQVTQFLSDKYGLYTPQATWYNGSAYASILSKIQAYQWTKAQADSYNLLQKNTSAFGLADSLAGIKLTRHSMPVAKPLPMARRSPLGMMVPLVPC